MAWSTRQLAQLAGTTVKTIRHYHEQGLLPLPQRRSNGYKQYGAIHLVRLLRIRRLRELGMSLPQIAALDAGTEDAAGTVRALDAELERTIAHLTRLRAELGEVLRHGSPLDVPPLFADDATALSDRQRSLLAVYQEFFHEEDMIALRDIVARASPADAELETLPEDASDAEIDALARRLAPEVRAQRLRHPWTADPAGRSPRGRAAATTALAHTVGELYHPGQIRVLQRVEELLGPDAIPPVEAPPRDAPAP